MAKTATQLLADVRVLLQDNDEPYRYKTDELIDHLNSGIYELKRLRPDVYLSTLNTDLFQYSDATLDTNLPFGDIYYQPMVLFVTGYAELRDDEFTVDGRAGLFLQSFAGQLTSPSRGVV